MHRFIFLIAPLACVSPACAQGSPGSTAPTYTAATIVNSATNTSDALAPNTLATIYGTNLSDGVSAAPEVLSPGSMLPLELADVRVFVAGWPAPLYYVSPQQINFLVPADLRPGDMNVFVARAGVAGPQAQITLLEVAPSLFQSQPGVVTATHADGSLITQAHPARPGETVTVLGTGLGATVPGVTSGMAGPIRAQIEDVSEFHILVNGAALPAASVLYAGVAPDSPGLYWATFIVPKSAASNPEIRIAIGSQSSQPGLRLPLA